MSARTNRFIGGAACRREYALFAICDGFWAVMAPASRTPTPSPISAPSFPIPSRRARFRSAFLIRLCRPPSPTAGFCPRLRTDRTRYRSRPDSAFDVPLIFSMGTKLAANASLLCELLRGELMREGGAIEHVLPACSETKALLTNRGMFLVQLAFYRKVKNGERKQRASNGN